MKLQQAVAPAAALPRALFGAAQTKQHQQHHLWSPISRRCYATHSSFGGSSPAGARRRAVTPFNDDGHVPWTELSAGEKTARAAQQTFNFSLVILGVLLTGSVGYFLYSEVFSPDSKVAYYNRAVDRIRKDPQCLELLGDAKSITAFGEETNNKWRRARPIASTTRMDPQGNDHLMIHFNVEGPRGKGVASMHLVKRQGQSEYEYRYFFVDVKGHQRIYLENANATSRQGSDKKRSTIFGINWS